MAENKNKKQKNKNKNTYLLYCPSILHVRMYPREINSYLYTKIVSASFTMDKSWKQHTCSSVGEWINKL